MSRQQRKALRAQAARKNPIEGQARLPQRPLAPETFCVSLKHYDPSQGQHFKDWEREELLAKLLDRWHAHSAKPLEQCLDQRFKRYGHFPEKSDFKHPPGVPEDAVWASMHIQGKQCVAGHIIGNVFYLVFLDCNHKFWPVEKRNT
jgi:hypothetical protein